MLMMTNSMLLWQTLDSVLLPLVIKPKFVVESRVVLLYDDEGLPYLLIHWFGVWSKLV